MDCTVLEPGDLAPDFTAARDGGGQVTLWGLRGSPVVLYFYPRDDTPGCTTEALEFTALAEGFAAAGATVIGVSRDTVTQHDRFKRKHGLSPLLVSDEDGSICNAYGVWVEKSMYGRTFMGIERSTFVINAQGRIAHIRRKVRPKGHARDILALLSS